MKIWIRRLKMKRKDKLNILNYLALFTGGFLIGYGRPILELIGVVAIVISAANLGTIKEKSRWTGE